MERDKAYFVKIEENPLHTPASVYETQKRLYDENAQTMTTLLYHLEEPNIVRGFRQEFSPTPFPQVRRPDLGLTWYHYKTLCIMQAKHGRPNLETLSSFAQSLMPLAARHLEGHSTGDLIFTKSDLYSKITGKQVAGISSTPVSNDNPVSIYRACFYTAPETTEAIEPLIKADPQANPQNVLDCFEVMQKGFIPCALQLFSPSRLRSDRFVSEESLELAKKLQNITPKYVQRGSCIEGLL